MSAPPAAGSVPASSIPASAAGVAAPQAASVPVATAVTAPSAAAPASATTASVATSASSSSAKPAAAVAAPAAAKPVSALVAASQSGSAPAPAASGAAVGAPSSAAGAPGAGAGAGVGAAAGAPGAGAGLTAKPTVSVPPGGAAVPAPVVKPSSGGACQCLQSSSKPANPPGQGPAAQAAAAPGGANAPAPAPVATVHSCSCFYPPPAAEAVGVSCWGGPLRAPGVASGLYIVPSEAMTDTLVTYLQVRARRIACPALMPTRPPSVLYAPLSRASDSSPCAFTLIFTTPFTALLQAITSDVGTRRGIIHVAVSGGSLVPLLSAAIGKAFEQGINLHTEKWMVWCVLFNEPCTGPYEFLCGAQTAPTTRPFLHPLSPTPCPSRPFLAGMWMSGWCRTTTPRATTAP